VEVVVAGCVVEVVARTVVVVDDGMGAPVGGGSGVVGVGAVVTTVTGAVVGAAATVVVVEVVLVVVSAGAEDVVVALTRVEACARVEATVVVSAACRLARSTDRDPPGGPRTTSAPMQRAANAIRAAQPRHASHVRCRLRDRSIASSSTNGPPT
jgi:hypothetical protein